MLAANWMRALVAGLVSLAACSPSGRPQTSPDAAKPGTDAPPSGLCYSPSVTGMVMASNPNLQACAVWNNVAMMSGNVTLSRDTTSLTMAFANGLTFAGSVDTTNHVMLVHSDLHAWSDGCTWRATETLTGPLDPATCVMTLSYAYQETVEVSNGACDMPCTGTADFSLQITPLF